MKSTNKLPNQIELEDLLNSFKNEDNTPTSSRILDYNEVLKFLTTFGIQPGDQLVHTSLIYEFYKQWTLEPKVTQTYVTNRIKRYIPLEVKGNNKYFLINKDSIRLTDEVFSYLKGLRKVSRTQSKHWGKHFQSFIESNKVSPGNIYIEDYILFNLYDKWTYEKKIKESIGTLGFKSFRQFCRMYLSVKIKNEQLYFGVDKQIMEGYLTEQKIEELRRYEKERSKKKHDAKKEKKKS